jgi:capsular exopolysaccharide synthesis family protein
VDLGHLVTVARRRWWVMVLAALLGCAGGFALSAASTPQYNSTVTVFFSLSRGGTLSVVAEGSQYVQDLVPSYARVARMPIVLDPVISRMGVDQTSSELAKRVTVDNEPSSVVTTITVTDSSAQRAADTANAVADELTRAVATLSPVDQRAGSIVLTTLQRAVPASDPTSPNLSVNLPVGLVAGLVLGFAAIVVLELIVSSPVNRREAVHRITSAPVLATVSADSRFRQRPLSISTHPRLARSEEYRILQTNLQILLPASLCVVVTSALPSEGKTSTAVNLAIGLSHASRRVLLVDAHFRSPAVAGLLGIAPEVGLTSVLSGQTDRKAAVHTWTTQLWGDTRLDVIPAGRLQNQTSAIESSGLLDSRAMADLMATWRTEYDAIVIDSAPVLTAVDGISLAAHADGAVLVVDSRRTRERHVAESIARLELAGATTLGVVLNRLDSGGEYLDQEPAIRRRLRPGSVLGFSSPPAPPGRHGSMGGLLTATPPKGTPAEVQDDGGVRADTRHDRDDQGQVQQGGPEAEEQLHESRGGDEGGEPGQAARGGADEQDGAPGVGEEHPAVHPGMPSDVKK